jgi:hypothetical protein
MKNEQGFSGNGLISSIWDETPVHSFLFTGFILLYCVLSGAVGIEGAFTIFLRFGFI